MESLKVLVVLLAVFHGSLSRQSNPDDELRVIVRQLEELVSRKWTGTPSPTPDTENKYPPGPRGPTDKESEPSSWKYDRMIKMFGWLLKPYFGTFPSGNYTSDIPVEKIVEMMNKWYTNTLSKSPSIPKSLRKQAFFNMARVLLRAHFQCATAKINQIIFYVLKAQERGMTVNDKSMYNSVRAILESRVKGEGELDRASKKIVGAAHRHVFGIIMSHIKYFQFKDTIEFFQKVKPFIRRAIKEKWSVSKFDQELTALLSDFDFGCPPLDDLWEFHRKLAVSFKQRFSEDLHFSEAEKWLTSNIPKYITTDPAPIVQEILKVYTGYVDGAVRNFEQVEAHMTTGNTDDITNFMSSFLTPEQLEYLKSIFAYLQTTDTDSSDMDSSDMDSSSYSTDEDPSTMDSF